MSVNLIEQKAAFANNAASDFQSTVLQHCRPLPVVTAQRTPSPVPFPTHNPEGRIAKICHTDALTRHTNTPQVA